MSDQTGLVSMPATYNLEQVRQAFMEGLGKCRLRTPLVLTGAHTLTGEGDLILADGTFQVDLPADPEDGDHYEFAQVNASGTLTIGRNGKTIRGAASNATVTTQWTYLRLTWSDDLNTWYSR